MQTSLKGTISSSVSSFHPSLLLHLHPPVHIPAYYNIPPDSSSCPHQFTQVEQNSMWHPTNIQWRPKEQKWRAKWFGKASCSVLQPSTNLPSLSAVYWIINDMTFNQHISTVAWCVHLCVCLRALCGQVRIYVAKLIDGWMVTGLSCKSCHAFSYLSVWKMMHVSKSSLHTRTNTRRHTQTHTWCDVLALC